MLIINIFIFTSAGFLYGWEQAMYSALTYIVAYKAIDMIIQGLSEEKSVRIISDKGKIIGQAIIQNLDNELFCIREECHPIYNHW